MQVHKKTESVSSMLTSYKPATGETLWEGAIADAAAVDKAVRRAKIAFKAWSLTSLQERISLLEKYATLLKEKREEITALIAHETGKVWREAQAEAGSLISKVTISLEAYHTRTGTSHADMDGGVQRHLTHRPHGIMAVFSPYNFPMHLPNGHIAPALLAGNTVVLKPSEETPACGELLVRLLHEAGFPEDVVQCVQGGRDTGVALANHPDIAGILFTGSYATGKKIHAALAGRPEVLLAMELGGNNPLIVHEADDAEAVASLIVESAFATTGQRCTCARRLILTKNAANDRALDALLDLTARLTVGAPDSQPEPYMGCMINNVQADLVLQGQAMLRSNGGRSLYEAARLSPVLPFMQAGIMDMTTSTVRDDTEIFGPLLQVYHVRDIEEAVQLANDTRYGLSAGLISDNAEQWEYVYPRLHAGLINYNRPLTGAASAAPFGGVGYSGNHRPTAYYAADYCAYPVATLGIAEVKAVPLVGVT
jgi:succinylglutamic semialdehyde dehydrogenase